MAGLGIVLERFLLQSEFFVKGRYRKLVVIK